MSSTGATLSGSFSGATGTISETGFYYGTSSGSLGNKVAATGMSSPFFATIAGLTANTKYYYKAYVIEGGQERTGAEESFTTLISYLDDYGIPALSAVLSGTGTSGTNNARGDHWYRYNTTNNKRQVAVHTYVHPDTSEETANYVVLYDESKYAPLWTAHTMNTTYWPDKGVDRSNEWTKDPAVSLAQISGLDDNTTYSRGHFVASSYRKSTDNQNAQTFYNTNKAPQYQNGFNQGVWSSLEDRVKAAAPSGSTTMMYVVTGVLYEGTLTYMSASSKNVPIPSHFYKCIMRCELNSSGTVTAAQGIAFVYTNASHTGQKYYASEFVTSIRSIEQRAGFDFFAKVPDNLEDGAESNTDPTWFIGASPNSVSRPTTFWGF